MTSLLDQELIIVNQKSPFKKIGLQYQKTGSSLLLCQHFLPQFVPQCSSKARHRFFLLCIENKSRCLGVLHTTIPRITSTGNRAWRPNIKKYGGRIHGGGANRCVEHDLYLLQFILQVVVILQAIHLVHFIRHTLNESPCLNMALFRSDLFFFSGGPTALMMI